MSVRKATWIVGLQPKNEITSVRNGYRVLQGSAMKPPFDKSLAVEVKEQVFRHFFCELKPMIRFIARMKNLKREIEKERVVETEIVIDRKFKSFTNE